jgi:membrane protein insertase Oxa1/YidC/SpoIIIJ
MWMTLVSAVESAITLIAAATGGNIGLAIVTVSVALRVALLPLTIRLALYSAISRGLGAGRRFLWISDLAKPDLLLVAITGALTYWTNIAGASRDVTRTAAVISAALTIAIMWRVSAALGLYWASSTAVGAVQAFWLRRRRTR